MAAAGTAGDDRRPPRRRADAERNRRAIVEAALRLFARQPDATMADVAAAAGVGRVTLYAHFPSRQALLEAVVERAVSEAVGSDPAAEAHGDAAAGAPPGTSAGTGSGHRAGTAADDMRALIRDSWDTLHRFGRLSAMVQRELGPERLRDRHGPVLDQVGRLVERGRADGSLRSDVPAGWLATMVYSLLHAAADEVDAGRLAAADVAGLLEATLLPALLPPLSS